MQDHRSTIADLSRVIAWCSFASGALSGMVMGLWSFDGPVPVPSWIGDYDSVARRLLRLGHIAFFGLAMLNLFLVRHMPTLDLSNRMGGFALGLMNFGNIALPLTLIAAAAYHPFKYVLPIPATSISLALVLAAYGAWSQFRSSRQTGRTQPGAKANELYDR
jgi:hypothetical protein